MANSSKTPGLRSADRGMRELRISAPGAGGLVLEELEENLAAQQCSELTNLWFCGDVLTRRPGQELLFAPPSGVDRLFSQPFEGRLVYTSEGGLWAWTEGEPSRLCALSDTGGCFFTYGGRLYYLCGEGLYCYDGQSAGLARPYVPTVCRGRSPDGARAGTAEDYNRLGRAFTCLFSPDGEGQTEYVLPRGGLSAAEVEVVCHGQRLAEGTDFTVDRAAGTVSFSLAPGEGEDAVRITAALAEGEERLLGCRRALAFGGEGEVRIFFAGAGGGEYFWSAAGRPDYVPEANRAVLGDAGEDITAMALQYSRLVLFKRGQVWSVEYDAAGGDAFRASPVSMSIGCDAPETVANIANRLVWLHTEKGVCTLLSTSLSSEKNVQPISRNVNGTVRRPGLLAEEGLREAVACEWRGHYLLFTAGACYLWDALRTPYVHASDTAAAQGRLAWYRWTGVQARALCLWEDRLVYHSGERGVCRLCERYIDFGQPFCSRIRLPLRDFGFPERYKNVLYACVTVRGDVNNSFSAAYVTEREAAGTPEKRQIRAVSFDLGHWNLSDFTLEAVNFQKTVRLRPHRRRIALFGMEFTCDAPDREMNICAVSYRYRTVGQVKN